MNKPSGKPMSTPNIDWATTMMSTDENARVAAKMTERAVGALAETLDILSRHSHRLSNLESMVEEIRTRPEPMPAQPLPSWTPPHRPRRHPRSLLVGAFIAGAVCGVFFGSW